MSELILSESYSFNFSFSELKKRINCVEMHIDNDGVEVHTYIEKDEAIKIVKHLTEQFELNLPNE